MLWLPVIAREGVGPFCFLKSQAAMEPSEEAWQLFRQFPATSPAIPVWQAQVPGPGASPWDHGGVPKCDLQAMVTRLRDSNIDPADFLAEKGEADVGAVLSYYRASGALLVCAQIAKAALRRLQEAQSQTGTPERAGADMAHLFDAQLFETAALRSVTATLDAYSNHLQQS